MQTYHWNFGLGVPPSTAHLTSSLRPAVKLKPWPAASVSHSPADSDTDRGREARERRDLPSAVRISES